jgi:hypothetical protein
MYSGKPQITQGEKLWVLHSDDPVVVFGGASNHVGAMHVARQRIERRLKPGMSQERVIDTINRVLRRTHEDFPHPGDPFVQALVVVRASGEENVLYFNEAGDTSLSSAYGEYKCVGAESLGEYLAEKLFRPGMSLQWASIVAAHLVAQCKTYANGYCGGYTHLISIPNKGKPKLTTGAHEIAELESYLDGIDTAYDHILPGGSPMESDPDDSLRARAEHIKTAINKAAHSFYLMTEPGHLSLQGHQPTVTQGPPPNDEHGGD